MKTFTSRSYIEEEISVGSTGQVRTSLVERRILFVIILKVNLILRLITKMLQGNIM